jgi:molecular chaperone GrpE
MKSDGEHEPNDLNASPPESAESVTNEAAAAELDLQVEIQKLRDEVAQWQDKYLRKLAEFDNYRKRTRQETDMLRQIVAESFIIGLLPILDDFDRMLSTSISTDDPLRKGVELICGKLRAVLDAHNVTKFDSIGAAFDPQQHDALFMQPTPDFPPGTVLNVIAPGYRMGDRVIRHAQVVVSAESVTESDDENNTNTAPSTDANESAPGE